MTSEERQIQLHRTGNVCIITLTGIPHKANVFTLPLLQRLNSLLDQVEERHLPCSLVLQGTSQFFSAGFDLEALTGAPHDKNSDNTSPKTPRSQELVDYSWQVLARLLVFPAPTVCLFTGHAFGLGLFLGLACDHRIMMENRQALLCLPEITLGLPLGSGFAALAKCKWNPSALRTAALTGKRWGYREALAEGIIDAVVPNASDAVELAEQLASTSEKGNLSSIKLELYRETHDILLSRSSSQSRAKL